LIGGIIGGTVGLGDAMFDKNRTITSIFLNTLYGAGAGALCGMLGPFARPQFWLGLIGVTTVKEVTDSIYEENYTQVGYLALTGIFFAYMLVRMPPINIENPTGNPSGYWGRTPQEIAHAFTSEGYNAQILPAKPGTSGLATRIIISGKSNTEQKTPVDAILIHPGGGVHSTARYIKFSLSNQKGATKLVEYAEHSTTYKEAGEKNTTRF
jgi:hypothetical protein